MPVAGDQQEIDIAPVVVVGRDDRQHRRWRRRVRRGRDVGESAVAVVAKQSRAGRTGGVAGPAGDKEIEVAVVIGVEPGRRRCGPVSPAQFGRGGDVDKAAGRIAPQEADAARTEDSEVGIVRRCRSRRPALPSPSAAAAAEHLAGHVGEAAGVVSADRVRLSGCRPRRSRSPSPSRSNSATRPAAASAGRAGCGLQHRRGIRERHVRHSRCRRAAPRRPSRRWPRRSGPARDRSASR